MDTIHSCRTEWQKASRIECEGAPVQAVAGTLLLRLQLQGGSGHRSWGRLLFRIHTLSRMSCILLHFA